LVFHRAIVGAASNPAIELLFRAVTGITIEMMRCGPGDPEMTRNSLPDRRQIRDGIAGGVDRVSALMTRH